jgi:hypothetical protein
LPFLPSETENFAAGVCNSLIIKGKFIFAVPPRKTGVPERNKLIFRKLQLFENEPFEKKSFLSSR